MELDLAIQAHFDNGFKASFKKIKEINGGILELPKNIIKKKPATKYIYEINDDSVNIYVNGVKEETIKCPRYGCRPFISVNIISKMIKYGLTTFLLSSLDENNEELMNYEKLHTKTSANLLDQPETRKNQLLEKELYDALDEFLESQNVELVTDKIEEAFNIITRHYIGSLNEA